MKPHLPMPLVIGAMVVAAPLAARADTYKVDGMHSMPAFTFRHLNLSTIRRSDFGLDIFIGNDSDEVKLEPQR
jgi:polyisoprenoid-binding protein YceI